MINNWLIIIETLITVINTKWINVFNVKEHKDILK